MMRPSPRTVLGLFDVLCFLKTEDYQVRPPENSDFLKWLYKMTGLGQPDIFLAMQELESKKLIVRIVENGLLAGIKICGGMPEAIARIDYSTPSQEVFAIFIDYMNLERGVTDTLKLSDFSSWLINPITSKGGIISNCFIFIPHHLVNTAPLMMLSNMQRFQVIACPRAMGAIITKNADSVDTKMIELAQSIICNGGITDIVVVSGDADFQPLVRFARWHGKKIRIISPEKAISGRFLDDKSLDVEIVS